VSPWRPVSRNLATARRGGWSHVAKGVERLHDSEDIVSGLPFQPQAEVGRGAGSRAGFSARRGYGRRTLQLRVPEAHRERRIRLGISDILFSRPADGSPRPQAHLIALAELLQGEAAAKWYGPNFTLAAGEACRRLVGGETAALEEALEEH
jgi:hypothetical protein